MQRFKKFAMKHGNVDDRGAPVVFGRAYGFAMAHEAVNIFTGKFVYGPSISDAAQRRDEMFTAIGLITTEIGTFAYGTIMEIESLRERAARLP